MTLGLNLLAYVVLSTSGLLLLRTGLKGDGALTDFLREPRVLIGAGTMRAFSRGCWHSVARN